MKSSPVLVLNLTALALSSASAAHAKDFLSFNLPPAQVAPYSTSSQSYDSAAAKSQLTSENHSNFKAGADISSAQDLPNLPLFELPPFQERSSTDTSNKRASDSSSENSYRGSSQSSPVYSSRDLSNESFSRSSEPTPVDRSPFQFPEGMTETDLFESEPSATQPGGSFNSRPEPLRSTPSTPPQQQEEPSTAIEPLIESSGYAVAKPLGLDFTPPTSASAKPPSTPLPADPAPAPALPPTPVAEATPKVDTSAIADGSLDAIFAGDSESLVAVAVGSAEGTRTPDGGRNSAYHGHVDPGNGVWNLGSFSYQHGADSPEQADAKQLARLRSQAETILQKASDKGIELTLEEKLNGIDLANQAPKAALDQQGYIDWLAEARRQGLTGSDAVLWARVRSFIDPYTQTWDAPGLGNSEDRITHDQERRMLQIAKAIATYLQNVANQSPPKASDQQASGASDTKSQSIAQSFIQLFAALRFQYS